MRDFEKDRKICEVASKGPWRAVERGNSVTSFAVVTVAYEGMPQKNICSAISPKTEDATFIAAARDGWPAALERITELENLLKMQDDALERAGSAARFAISQEDAEKLRGIVFADNGDEIEKKLEQEADEIESLKRQLQVAAEVAMFNGCPVESSFNKPEFCVAQNSFVHCKQDEAECWKKYFRQKANSKDNGANSDDSGTFQNGNNHKEASK